MVYKTCCSVEPDLPGSVKLRMQMNMAIDFAVGLIPFIGDIADAAYKCNTRNVILLEKELRERGQNRIKGTPAANLADPSLPHEFDFENEERLLNNQNGPPPRYTSTREPGRSQRNHQGGRDVEQGREIAPPLPARR